MSAAEDALVAAMARAVAQDFYASSWAETSEFRRGVCLSMSRAALAALRAQGVALVPVEPTEAMLDAMGEMHMPFGEMRAAWDGALAASPYAPPPECAP